MANLTAPHSVVGTCTPPRRPGVQDPAAQREKRCEGAGELAVAGCYASELLEVCEGVFDDAAGPVCVRVVRVRKLPRPRRGDHRLSRTALQVLLHSLAVVRSVGKEPAGLFRGTIKERNQLFRLCGVSGSQAESQEPARSVGKCDDFGGWASSACSDCFVKAVRGSQGRPCRFLRRAPRACWWTLINMPSIWSVPKSSSLSRDCSNRSKTPRCDHRRNRWP